MAPSKSTSDANKKTGQDGTELPATYLIEFPHEMWFPVVSFILYFSLLPGSTSSKAKDTRVDALQ